MPDASVNVERNPSPPLWGTSKVTVVLGGKQLAVSVTAVPSGPDDGVSVSEGPDGQLGLFAGAVVPVVTGTVVPGAVFVGAVFAGAVFAGAVFAGAVATGVIAVVGAATVGAVAVAVGAIGAVVGVVSEEKPPVTVLQGAAAGATTPVPGPEAVGARVVALAVVVVPPPSVTSDVVGGTVIASSGNDVGLEVVTAPEAVDAIDVVVAPDVS